MPAAGRFDRRVAIERGVESQAEGSGGVVYDYMPWIQRWARRRDLRGSEAGAQPQTVAIAECIYEVRSDTDTRTISAHEKYRLADGDRRYDIVSAEPSEQRNRMIVLRVRARGEVAA